MGIIFRIIGQLFLLLFIFRKDKNDGEKELFKRQQWTASDVILVLLLTMAVPLYVVFVAYLFLKLNIDIRARILNLSEIEFGFYSSIVILLILTVLFKYKFKQDFRILGIQSNSLTKYIGAGLLIALLAFVVTMGPPQLFLKDKFDRRIIEIIKNLKAPLDYVMLFCGTILLGPLEEEIIYRGILYSPFRKKYGPPLAIFIISFFWGFSHASLSAFVVALFLTVLYERTESLISTYIAHSVCNLLVISLALFTLK